MSLILPALVRAEVYTRSDFICGRAFATSDLQDTLRQYCDPNRPWQINTLDQAHYWCCISNGRGLRERSR